MSRAPIAALICVAASLAAPPARPAAGTRGQDATTASVQTLLSAGRYDEAETEARAQADEVRRTHGAGSLEAAFASELLLRVLRLNGRAAAPETLSLAERTVQETTARLGLADLRLAPALIDLGDVLVAEAEVPNEASLHSNGPRPSANRVAASRVSSSRRHSTVSAPA